MTQLRWLERLIGGTRQHVVEFLLKSDSTVQEIADKIGVSTNAIRGHLSALERDGLVEQLGVKRDTGGKPAAVYALSNDAHELFPRAYSFVLDELLSRLDAEDGSDRVEALLTGIGNGAATPAEGPPSKRVEAAADLLRSLGATVEVLRDGDHWKIQGFSCPLSALTATDPRMCGLATALVQKASGGSVVEVCDRGPRPRCAFEIAFQDDSES